MSIKFKSSIESEGKIIQSKHRAIKHTDTVQTLEVKVVTKTAAHPEHGNGSSYGYTIDGVEGAYLELTPGITYRFDQSDGSNGGTGTGGNAHPLRFATAKDAAGSTAYTGSEVTTNGSPGSSGAYTQIIPTTTTPPILHYYCSSHGNMGSYAKFGTGTVGDTYSINASVNSSDSDDIDLNLDAASGTDSVIRLTAGSNINLTRNGAQQVTIESTASGGDTYDLNAVQDGNNVDINLTSGSGSDNSVVQLTAGTGITLTRNSAAEVTVASSSSSSGGQVTTQLNVSGDGTTQATDGSRTQFTIASAPASENNLQIYIDGVYQSKNDFSVSGTTVTLDAAPATGAVLEIIHFVVVNANIFLQTHTATSGQTSFNAGGTISSENDTQVYIDGVYQSKNNYSVSGSNVVLDTAPATGAVVEIVNIRATAGDNDSSGAIDWQSTHQNSNFTAVAGKGYFINTTSSAITMTMPSSPSVGDTVAVIDAYFKFQSNALTIASSDKINGQNSNFLLSTVGKAVEMVYSGSVKGWLVATDADDHAAEDVMKYLVVAGGGAGGNYLGGGGGAGGIRSGNFIPTSGVQYTATVGQGGAGVNAYAVSSAANNGGNSSLAGSGITTVNATGGGGGGSYSGGAGASGGSGGGGGIQEGGGGGAAGAGNSGGYSPVEGYAGGAGKYRSAGAAYGPSGAGGGASEAGDDGLINQGIPASGHKGGDGITSNITGLDVIYGGGGGAATYSGSTANGVSLGGAGGGGNGAGNGQPATGNSGTDGLGGGGGGGTSDNGGSGKGGDGGDGVVILSVPTLYYTGTTTGSPTVTTSGAQTIIKFTGSGTYTH